MKKKRYGTASKALSIESNNTESLSSWANDPKKMVELVLRDSPKMRRELIAGVFDLAQKDEQFRRDMLDKLKFLGEGKKAPLIQWPKWRKELLVFTVDLVMEHRIVSSQEKAFEHIEEHMFFGKTKAKTLSNYYYSFKKRN